MTDQQVAPNRIVHLLSSKNVLAGLMFIGVALVGLWESRHYTVGTALRMGTGYVPRLLCWALIGLGSVILLQGMRESAASLRGAGMSGLRPVIFVTAGLVVFGLTIEWLGLVISIFLLIGIGAIAARTLRPLETLIAAIALILLSWVIFIVGLGLTIPVWPEW
jgi:putative tricarboxylic transport membrane protein